jgi:hypothetical protein
MIGSHFHNISVSDVKDNNVKGTDMIIEVTNCFCPMFWKERHESTLGRCFPLLPVSAIIGRFRYFYGILLILVRQINCLPPRLFFRQYNNSHHQL